MRAVGTSRTWSAVETPNPDVRKFQRPSPSQGLADSARLRLLQLEGVRDVFMASANDQVAKASTTSPWIAVTRKSGTSWESLESQVQAVLEEALVDDVADSSGGSVKVDATDLPGPGSVEAEIIEVLEHRVRPSVQEDGGDIELLRWEADVGQVVLRLRGACRGCPQSAVTLHGFV